MDCYYCYLKLTLRIFAYFFLSAEFATDGAKTRPVSAGICVSQKKLRQIDDPSQKLLMQLHKIIYISQLPPASHSDVKRRLVEKFKKSLFQSGSDPYNLKVELGKLLQASPELMATNSSEWWPLVHHYTGGTFTADTSDDGNFKDGVTYQQMQGIIEDLLGENGYYTTTKSRISERTNEPCHNMAS